MIRSESKKHRKNLTSMWPFALSEFRCSCIETRYASFVFLSSRLTRAHEPLFIGVFFLSLLQITAKLKVEQRKCQQY